jgi:hypothetical protein
MSKFNPYFTKLNPIVTKVRLKVTKFGPNVLKFVNLGIYLYELMLSILIIIHYLILK